MYTYKSKHLFKAMVDNGISVNEVAASVKMYRKKLEGKFTPPTLPNKTGGWWRFKKEHIDQIIKAFSPGGSGEWHFNKTKR